MKNQNQTLQQPGRTELRATKAIQNIQNWMDTRYPAMAALSKSKMIIECLIELNEEKRFLAQQ